MAKEDSISRVVKMREKQLRADYRRKMLIIAVVMLIIGLVCGFILHSVFSKPQKTAAAPTNAPEITAEPEVTLEPAPVPEEDAEELYSDEEEYYPDEEDEFGFGELDEEDMMDLWENEDEDEDVEGFYEDAMKSAQAQADVETPAEPAIVVMPTAVPEQPAAPVAVVDPAAEAVAPVATVEPAAEAVAPVAAAEPAAEVVAPVAAIEPAAEAVAPVAAVEPAAEAVAPVAAVDPAVAPVAAAEAVAPVAAVDPAAQAVAPVAVAGETDAAAVAPAAEAAAPIAVAAPVATAAPVGSMENPVPLGDEFTIKTDIDAQGSYREFEDGTPCETISITMKVHNYLGVDYYQQTYGSKYDLKTGTAAAVLEMTLNGYQGNAAIIPQNCLLLQFRGENPNVTVQGVQMIDREIAGNKDIALTNGVKRTLYKRYYYDPAVGEMRYLDVTAYVGGQKYTYSFDLRRPEMTAEQKEAEKNGLTKGAKGDDVKRLQEALISAGMLSGTADGSFGSKTADAVKAMQRSLGMEETGIAGPMFQKALYGSVPAKTYAKLEFGAKNEDVTTLQNALIKMEVLEAGNNTGYYGTKTVEAVKKAQTKLGLEPTGTADSVFLSTLYNS